MGGSGAFIAKHSKTTSWHELLHYFSLFSIEFLKAAKRSQMVRNAPKHEFRVQWGGSGAFVAKNSDATSWQEIFALIAPVQPVLHQASCSNETIQNATKHYERQKYMSLGFNGVGPVHSLQKKSDVNSWHKLLH